jgi:hypothetical protein
LLGAASVTYTPVAVLTGSGALLGSAALSFTPSGALTGAGALLGSSGLTFGGSGTLTSASAGALSGTAGLSFTATGVLTGSGELLGVSSLTFDAAGVLAAQTQTPTEQPSGGWLFHNEYEIELRRRRERERERERLETESAQIADETSREIAQLLRVQEAEDERRKELQRLGELARAHADLEAAKDYSEKVATAYARALRQGNFSALEALDRELRKAAEEEEFLLIATMMFLH